MVEDADCPDDLTGLLDLLEVLHVAGVADDHWGLGLLTAALDASDLPSAEEDLVHRGVEHVGAAVDGAEPREGLREATQAVDRVEEWRITILTERFHVKCHLLKGICRRLI